MQRRESFSLEASAGRPKRFNSKLGIIKDITILLNIEHLILINEQVQLKEYFDKFGEIESVNLKLDPVTGRCWWSVFMINEYWALKITNPFTVMIIIGVFANRSRCFAFLVFKEKESVEKVFPSDSSFWWSINILFKINIIYYISYVIYHIIYIIYYDI